MITIEDAIKSLHPTAKFVVINEKITEWHSEDITQPTDEAIATEQARLQAEYDANQYQRDRVYPQLGEQFDKLWHDINNGTLDNTGEFFTALKEVKDNNPKPGA
jgi:hypothetical protein